MDGTLSWHWCTAAAGWIRSPGVSHLHPVVLHLLTVWNLQFTDVFVWDVVEMFHKRSQSVMVRCYDHLATLLHNPATR